MYVLSGFLKKRGTSKFKHELKIFLIRTRPLDRYPTTLYLDQAYIGILIDADVLLDILLDDIVPLDLVHEDLILANIATIQGLIFQCDRVDRSVALLNTSLRKASLQIMIVEKT